MATTPRTPVQPPRRLPPALTLIGASRTLLGDVTPDGQGPPRWEGGGVAFQPLPCSPDFEPFEPGCSTVDLSSLPSTDEQTADTTVLWVGEQCSSASWETGIAETRVRELLEVDQHRQLEDWFWDEYLSVGATNVGTAEATPLRSALVTLQQALADCGRGMIHTSLEVASMWHAEGMVRREGSLMLDAFDNVIVPGVGYVANGWAYGTGPVDTRIGEVAIHADQDTDTNVVFARAQRNAIAYVDPCCHFGIEVDLCTIDCTTPTE